MFLKFQIDIYKISFFSKKVEEVRRQLHSNPKIKTGEEDPDYKACVRISTQASLKEMIAPGLLVCFLNIFFFLS